MRSLLHTAVVALVCVGACGALIVMWLCLWITDSTPRRAADRARQAGL